ncbi:DUF2895 family protein [Thiomicrorhabdus indica]|uniref:DUF2895 family protein n=1 Tax=Thiomicrorhabdus indica TaxID=2267253 RepID=UPI00102DAD7C|nr:DUF2895 family protein [Thiomicrorhabdus indica]
MSGYVDQQNNDRSHINSLRVVIGVLVLFLSLMFIIVLISLSEPEKQRISLPPSLKYGAEVSTGEIYSWEVYNFAGSLFQQLNLWRDDAKEDYLNNIKSYRALMTKRYLSFKLEDYQERLERRELDRRARSVVPLGSYSVNGDCGAYDDKCVQDLGGGRWKVWLDVRIKEDQFSKKTNKPYEIKNMALRIPVLVVAEDDDPQYNPWGLKIDQEFTAEIQQIDLDAERQKWYEQKEAKKNM